MKRIALVFVTVAVVLSGLAAACSPKADPAAVEKAVRATLTAMALPAKTARPTFTPAPTDVPPAATVQPAAPAASLPPPPTSLPTALPTVDLVACAPAAQFVADVTIPDNSKVTNGTTFTKIWRVRNTGKCPWNASYRLSHASGDLLGGPDFVPLPETPVGAEADIAVTLKSPVQSGTYKGVWQICAFGASCFGPRLSVVIVSGPAQ